MKILPEEPAEHALVKSVLRDLMAAVIAAGAHASITEEWPSPSTVADMSYEQADELLKRSKTPEIIDKLKPR